MSRYEKATNSSGLGNKSSISGADDRMIRPEERKRTGADSAITISRQCENAGTWAFVRSFVCRKLFFRAGTFPGRREAFFVLTRNRSLALSLFRSPPIFLGDFPRALSSETSGKSWQCAVSDATGVHHRFGNSRHRRCMAINHNSRKSTKRMYLREKKK